MSKTLQGHRTITN